MWRKHTQNNSFVCQVVFWYKFLKVSNWSNTNTQNFRPCNWCNENDCHTYPIKETKKKEKCCIVTKTSNFFLVFRSIFRWRYLSEKMKFSVVLQRKQAIGQLFVEDVYIFPIISFRKRDRRIADLFFFSFMVMKARSLTS